MLIRSATQLFKDRKIVIDNETEHGLAYIPMLLLWDK